MTDICIYTNPDTLEHKSENNKEFYWWLRHQPRKLNLGDKIYFATKGFIKGYFLVDKIEHEYGGCHVSWKADTWKEINHIPTKHCQGFKYMKKLKKSESNG